MDASTQSCAEGALLPEGPGGAASLGLWAYVGVLTLIVPTIFTVRRQRLAWPAWIAAILTLIA
jgi:hypothetical protein